MEKKKREKKENGIVSRIQDLTKGKGEGEARKEALSRGGDA